MGEAARTAGVSLQAPETTEMDREAVKFATAPVDYIYEQPPEELLTDLLPRYVAIQIYQSSVGVGGCRECGAHDRHGFGDQQCQRRD